MKIFDKAKTLQILFMIQEPKTSAYDVDFAKKT